MRFRDLPQRNEFADTGVGIPPGKHDVIFDPFVQVHRDLRNPTEGTGLGLAISRDLARGMGGDLSVRSVEGKGSTFTIVLPSRPPIIAERPQEPPPRPTIDSIDTEVGGLR